jgi:hypothetical protein
MCMNEDVWRVSLFPTTFFEKEFRFINTKNKHLLDVCTETCFILMRAYFWEKLRRQDSSF